MPGPTAPATARSRPRASCPEALERDLLGRNVLAGRWTLQVVEGFDDGDWTVFGEHERRSSMGGDTCSRLR